MKKNSKNTERDNQDFYSLLSAFSHKLKNPVHSIGINAEVVRTKVKKTLGKNSKDIQKHLDMISDELSNLNRITGCLAEFLLTQKSKPANYIVHKLILEVINFLRLNDCESYEQVDYIDNGNRAKIVISKEDITRALVEIIINAREASFVSGRIKIEVNEKQNVVGIVVADTGHGIPKKDQKRIFDLFYTTKKGKLGCGLSLAKWLIEVNGGQVDLDSKFNRGTTFILKFDIAG